MTTCESFVEKPYVSIDRLSINSIVKTERRTVMNGKSIAIVDPDLRFSKALSERLHHYLPTARITRYSPSELITQGSMIPEEIILYDNSEIRPEAFTGLISTTVLPLLIPLRSGSAAGDIRLSGKLIFDRILSSEEGEPNLTTSPFEREKSGVLRLFLLLGSRALREKYIQANTGMLISSGHRLIRMDLMSGISIAEPKSSGLLGRKGNQVLSGYSDLLLRLGGPDPEPETLLDYLRPNGSGWLYFGRPSRSDDIISLDSDSLVRLVRMLRVLTDRSTPVSSAIVVIEGLAFSKIRKLCPLAHEMHVIYPDDAADDDPLVRYELEQLFSAAGPKQLKFISSAGKEAI